MGSLKTPRNSREISQVWLEGILSEHESKRRPGTAVRVISFKVNPGAKPGDNFNSELVKVIAEARVSGNSEQVTPAEPKTYYLVAKFLIGDEFQQEAMKQFRGHIKELLIYSNVIAEFNNYQSSHISQDDKYRIDIPEFIFGKCTDKEYVLVMENVSPAGYANPDNKTGLKLDEVTVAVECMAKLHGLSYAYNKTQGTFTEKYPDFEFRTNMVMFFKALFTVVFKALMKTLRHLKDHEELYKKIKANMTPLMDNIVSLVVERKTLKIFCLCHNDFWTNNLLFKRREDSEEDGQSSIEHLMLIDWQNAMWYNPIFDVQYLVNTSCTLTLRQDHLEEILQLYYSTFRAITDHLNDPVITRYSYENFKEDWKKTKFLGVIMGALLSMMSLSEAGKTFREKDLQRNPSTGIVGQVKTCIARRLLSLFEKEWTQPVAKRVFKRIFAPIVQELKAGNNEVLMTRILDLLTEADAEGAFDV